MSNNAVLVAFILAFTGFLCFAIGIYKSDLQQCSIACGPGNFAFTETVNTLSTHAPMSCVCHPGALDGGR